MLLSFTTQAAAYLCCDLTLLPFSAAAFPLFTFGLRTLLVNMTQLRVSTLHAARRQRRTRQGCCCWAGAAQAALTRELYMGKHLKSAPCAEK